ncbi:MAG: GIY-YIG nuclease family protein [Hyphomicrobiaceae bacterium]
MRDPSVYILAKSRDGMLYTGCTSDLHGRMAEHVQGLYEGYTKRHGIRMLVYYEMHDTMDAAIARERRTKEWPRAWKVRLINAFNPEWRDLFDETTGAIEAGPADIARLMGNRI